MFLYRFVYNVILCTTPRPENSRSAASGPLHRQTYTRRRRRLENLWSAPPGSSHRRSHTRRRSAQSRAANRLEKTLPKAPRGPRLRRAHARRCHV